MVASYQIEVYKLVVKWAYTDEEIQVFLENKETGNKKDRQWFNNNSHKFQNDFKKADVTLLHELLQIIGKKISFYESPLNHLEFILKRFKNYRNEVQHSSHGDSKSAAISENTYTDIHDDGNICLRLAGERYNIAKDVLEDALRQLEKTAQAITSIKLTDRDRRLEVIKTDVNLVLKPALCRRWKTRCSEETLPFGDLVVDRREVFHDVKLKRSKVNDENFVPISSSNILLPRKCASKLYPSLIIEGGPGFGKTTLVKRICDEFYLSTTEEKCFNVNQFDLVLPIECRERTFSNFESYLSEVVNSEMPNFKDDPEVAEVVSHLKCLLIIDGVDELNTNSKKLIIDIMNKFCYKNSKFIFTSRPGESSFVRTILKKKGMAIETLTLQEIVHLNEKLTFLERYQKSICADGLVNTFETKHDVLGTQCSTPVSLTQFSQLYKMNKSSVRNWASGCNMMTYVLELCRMKVLERINEVLIIDSPDYITNSIIDIVCQHSLKCLHGQKLTIDANAFQEIQNDCRKLNENIPISSCLSCILQHHASFLHNEVSFSFPHKSFQEFLVSRIVLKKMEMNSGANFFELLQTLLGETASPFDMQDMIR